VSVSENCVRFGDRLALLIDAGVAVKDAAATLGIPRQRCYAVVRAMGRPVASSRPVRREVDPGQVVAVFNATGSMNQAAKAAGVSHSLARRLLVAEGLVSATRQPRGKAAAKRWFLDLIDSGWSASRAAREVGVHERTGRDWRDGVRKIGDTRIHPDGVVVDYRTGDRYLAPVITSGNDAPRAISTRYLSMQDRLTIDDGLLSGQTLTQITADINKHTSTVSREVRAHRVDGLYLPYHADAAAARARARPSSPNWWLTRTCAKRSRTVCPGGCRQNRSRTACAGTSRTTRACR
jgi:transposase, IS30 family